jgi:hypothetical protein
LTQKHSSSNNNLLLLKNFLSLSLFFSTTLAAYFQAPPAQPSRRPTFDASRVKPQDDESPRTEAMAQALARYGNELLKWHESQVTQTLKQRHVTERGKLSQFTIELREFYESSSGWDYDLQNSQNIAGMKQQVEQAVEFLKAFHLDLMGSSYPPFYTLVLKPISNWSSWGKLTQRGFELSVYVPGGDYALNASLLRDLWNRCDHLGKLCSSRSAKMKWAFLNPVGTVQTQLRQTIRRSVSSFFGEIEWFVQESSRFELNEAKNKLRDIVDRFTHQEYRAQDKRLLRDILDAALAKSDTVEDVVGILRGWQSRVMDEQLENEVSQYYTSSWVLGRRFRLRPPAVVASVFYFEFTDDIVVTVGQDTITTDPAFSSTRPIPAGAKPGTASSNSPPDYIFALLAIRINETETIDVGNVGLQLGRLLGVQSVALERALRSRR